MIKFLISEQNKDRMRKNKRTKRSTILHLPAISSIRSHFLSHHPFSFSVTPSFLTFYHTILSHFLSHYPFSSTITPSFHTFHHRYFTYLIWYKSSSTVWVTSLQQLFCYQYSIFVAKSWMDSHHSTPTLEPWTFHRIGERK